MSNNSLKISLAGRYAGALLDLAYDAGKLEKTAEDMLALQRMLASSADLLRVTKSRILKHEDVENALGLLLKKANFDALAIKFIKVLSENRRIDILPEIIEAFFSLLDKKENRVNAEVTTALPLAKEESDKLARALEKISGRKVRITAKQDREIMGGFKVKLGSSMLDSSVAGKLERLKINLEKAN